MVAVELAADERVVWQIFPVPGPRAPTFEAVFASSALVPEAGDIIVLANQFTREQRVVVAYVEPSAMELATNASFTIDVWSIYVTKEV
jgi:hypothetical protein